MAELTNQDDLPEKAMRIVQAAVDAIYEKGLDQVKLTDVARNAGVTTGAVTYYFEDKDALLMAAFEYSCVSLLEQMHRAGGGWTIQRFLGSLPTTAARRRRWSVWLAFCGRAQASSEINRAYRDFYRAVEDAVAEITEIEDSERAAEVAGMVVAAMDGIGLCATLNPRQWPAERQRRALEELLAPLFPSA